MATLHDRYIAALTAKGERVVASASRKYTTMTRAAGGFYFIGSAGAVRYGRCATDSRAAGDAWKAKLITTDLVA